MSALASIVLRVRPFAGPLFIFFNNMNHLGILLQFLQFFYCDERIVYWHVEKWNFIQSNPYNCTLQSNEYLLNLFLCECYNAIKSLRFQSYRCFGNYLQ